ncbi:hypothetical protein RB594_004156 [Gaeumannomyces avenae]
MPPVKNTGPPFKEEERVFCFHMDMLYEARILEVQAAEAGEGPAGGWQYKIHYKGWKNTWDDWVPQDRVRKFNDENKELASQLREQMKSQQKGSKAAASAGAKRAARGAAGAAAANGGSDFSSLRGSEERTAAHTTSSGRGPRRARDYDLEQEENFQNRPSIKLAMPDHLKAMLVDDWENITKNQQLVPIPHPHPFDNIVKDYVEWELPHRPDDSAEKDLLEETMSGLREYFNKALGRILLYKFERTQYLEIREQWESPSEGGHKCVADTYGAEHLLRLLVSLPELVAQTNMDQQSVNRLREEISKFTNWLAKNYAKYFVSEYETPAQDYIEKARSS